MPHVWIGPEIELFELKADDQRPAARPSDFGLQHFAFCVDDMDGAISRFEAAGGRIFSKANPFLFPKGAGLANGFCYGQTPGG